MRIEIMQEHKKETKKQSKYEQVVELALAKVVE